MAEEVNKQSGCAILVVAVFLIIVFSSLADSCSPKKTSYSPPPKPVIRNSEWDGSVYQVERWLKNNLKDPDSFEAIAWGKVERTTNGYSVWCRYRAKNSFGGYVVEAQKFTINDDGVVTSATRIE